MSFIRTRIIKGNPYTYLETRWREGGRVRSKSVMLKRRGGGSGTGGPPEGRDRAAMLLTEENLSANAKAVAEGRLTTADDLAGKNSFAGEKWGEAPEATQPDAPDTDGSKS